MTAYYNEIDPYAAEWLRNLIAAGHIAPGVVDTRSIEDVHPADLQDFTQCHFFAGIGVWSLALRRAGWPDDRPVWTGSCPCQPFSAAGQGAGFADERHLWPAFHHLIRERKPAKVLGEQVASKDADPWVDLVHTDMEALGYAFGAVPFPSAGIGAPHIRDRLYWAGVAIGRVADAERFEHKKRLSGLGKSHGAQRSGAAIEPPGLRMLDGLDHPHLAGLEGLGGGYQAEGGRLGAPGPAAAPSELGGLADADGRHASAERQQRGGEQRQQPENGRRGGVARRREQPGAVFDADTGSGPTNGYWRAADWLGCRDGKWRPVEPGTFPLAHGAPARVGRLRAYGNAINAEAARVFVEAVMEAA